MEIKPCPFCGGKAEYHSQLDNLFDFDWYKAVHAAAVLDCAVGRVPLARVLRYVTEESE